MEIQNGLKRNFCDFCDGKQTSRPEADLLVTGTELTQTLVQLHNLVLPVSTIQVLLFQRQQEWKHRMSENLL